MDGSLSGRGRHSAEALHQLPKTGASGPWKFKQNYFFDIRHIRRGRVDDDALQFTKRRAAVPVSI